MALLGFSVFSYLSGDGKVAISYLGYSCAVAFVSCFFAKPTRKYLSPLSYKLYLVAPVVSGVLFFGVVSIGSFVNLAST